MARHPKQPAKQAAAQQQPKQPAQQSRRPQPKSVPAKPAAPALLPTSYEVEMAPGLEEIAYQEIRQQLGKQLYRLQPLAEQPTRGAIRFRCRPTGGSTLTRVLQLNTIFSAYLVLPFAVSRPKSLLAHEHFTSLVEALQQLRQHFPLGHFANFGLSAAGADSAIFQQLTGQLQTALNLPFASEAVDLLLRIRPAPGNAGWEVLIRLTPRPLSVRDWRVADMKGALNAAVAHAMVRLTRPTAEDKFLNLACGSGTLLIERLLAAPARRVIGCDIDARALQYAEQNLKAAQLHAVVELYEWNAHSLNLPSGYVDAICADLPFGIAVGAHEQNVIDYPQILAEAARVAKPRAPFVLITQEVTLLEGLLAKSPSWKVIEQIKVDLRGLHPRIFVLQRST